jgi:hypothetical protein
MINQAISLLSSSLNQYLRRQFDMAEDVAVPSNIVEHDGAVVPHTNNKVLISLVNIEKETVPGSLWQSGSAVEGKSVSSYPPVHLNLYLMFTANFSGTNYAEALKFLSHVVGYFQSNPVFNHDNAPDLDHRIEKLTLDIENLNMKDLSSLWTIISGKYMPSILYKVRMITYDGQEISARIPKVTTPEPAVVP